MHKANAHLEHWYTWLQGWFHNTLHILIHKWIHRSRTWNVKYEFMIMKSYKNIWELVHLQWQSQCCKIHKNTVTMDYNILVIVSIVNNGLQWNFIVYIVTNITVHSLSLFIVFVIIVHCYFCSLVSLCIVAIVHCCLSHFILAIILLLLSFCVVIVYIVHCSALFIVHNVLLMLLFYIVHRYSKSFLLCIVFVHCGHC